LVIRPASPDDAPEILAVHRAARAVAYAHLGPPEEAVGRSTADSWRATLESGCGWLFVENELVLGFAVVVGAKLAGLYVHPDAQGRGIGSALHDAAVAGGARELWVYEEHGAAREFYERHGWVAEPETAHVGEDWALKRPALRYRLA
jgi:GNAT superfamily N-acetyltransferase